MKVGLSAKFKIAIIVAPYKVMKFKKEQSLAQI